MRPLLVLALGLAPGLLAACAPSRAAAGEPGKLVLRVDGRVDHPASSTEVWLRGREGTDFGFFGRGDTCVYEALSPGNYDVAAKIPSGVDGPWIYASQRLEVDAGRTTDVRLEPGDGRTARLVIETRDDTPPFFLVLAEAGTAFPTRLPDMGERFSQQRFPDDLYFALQSDGRSRLDRIPPLAPGTYTLFQCANDWEEGDPAPRGRTRELTLEAGRTTTVHLEDRLQRMTVSTR